MTRHTQGRDSLEPASPESTDSDSPPEDIPQTTQTTSSGIFHFASHLTSSLGGAPSKRRLPGGSAFAAASHTRDAKSRRREDDPRRHLAAGHNGGWVEGMEKREKDDLVDAGLAEHLKKEFGDPFQEIDIKSAA